MVYRFMVFFPFFYKNHVIPNGYMKSTHWVSWEQKQHMAFQKMTCLSIRCGHAIFPKYSWVFTFDLIQISISKTNKPNFTLRIKAKKTLRPTLNIFEKKNHVNKNQGWEPIHQKQKANENKNRHNPKEKKLKNQQKSNKHPMQRGLMATKW